MRYYFSLNILLLGQLLLLQKSEGLSKTICQWNSRKIVSTSGYYTLTTLRASNYQLYMNFRQNGYINGQPFGTPQHSLTECIINGKRFPCYYNTLYGLDVTTLEFTDITDIDSVVINSTYPVTVHRVKKPAHSTKIPRFHLVESTKFNYCPRWNQQNLTWTLIGDLGSTQPLTCFANEIKICQGTTTDVSNESKKCVVSEASGKVSFAMTVSRPNANRLSYYYCQLDTTVGEIVTYVVDWRDSRPIPEGGIPPITPPNPPTALPLLTCKQNNKLQGTS